MSSRPIKATQRPRTGAALWGVACATLLLCMASPGCRHSGKRAYHEDLMTEKRILEDQLYDLAYEYEILERKLHSQSGVGNTHEYSEIEVIPGEQDANPVLDPDYPGEGSRGGNDETTKNDADSGNDNDSAPPPLGPLVIETPDTEPDAEPNKAPPNDSGGINDLPPPSLTPSRPNEDGGLRPEANPTIPPVPEVTPPTIDGVNQGAGATRSGVGHVAEIRLNPVHTGGEDFDKLPGDDGVAVLIEPRSTRGEVLTQPGKVSIVVVDPAAPSDRARIARWDLSEQETAEYIQNRAGSRGIQLKLPWPQSRPEHSKLHLFVRYETSDGRKLESDREFFITLQGAVANRWTPRSRKRSQPRTARGSGEATSESGSQNPSSVPSNPSNQSAEARSTPGEMRPANAISQPPRPTPPTRHVTRPEWRPVR